MRIKTAGTIASLVVLSTVAVAAPSHREYHDFAMKHDGDARAGQTLFNSPNLACTKCHSTDGHGGKAGPDLFAIDDKFPRRELIDAVLNPSASIAVGYETTIIATKSGDEFTGVIKGASADSIELMQGDGQRVRVATGDIATAQRAASLIHFGDNP